MGFGELCTFALRADDGQVGCRLVLPLSVSGRCWLERCARWPASFSPQTPPKINASLFAWFIDTMVQSDCSEACAFAVRLLAFGLVPFRAEALRRSPGSRACCFSACIASKTAPGSKQLCVGASAAELRGAFAQKTVDGDRRLSEQSFENAVGRAAFAANVVLLKIKQRRNLPFGHALIEHGLALSVHRNIDIAGWHTCDTRDSFSDVGAG